MNTPKTDNGTLLKSTALFAVGLRVRYDNMEGEIEDNPDYLPNATMDDYASGKYAPCCMYRWIVRSGSDGFYPESVLAHGGKLYSANVQGHAPTGECNNPTNTKQ